MNKVAPGQHLPASAKMVVNGLITADGWPWPQAIALVKYDLRLDDHLRNLSEAERAVVYISVGAYALLGGRLG